MLSSLVICGLVGWFSFGDPTVGWLVVWLLLMSASVGDHCLFDCWSAVSCCWFFECYYPPISAPFRLAGSQCAAPESAGDRPPSSHRKCTNCVSHMMSGMSKDVWVCFMHAHYIERACTNCLLKHATHTAWCQPCDQSITHTCMGHPSIRSLSWQTDCDLLLSARHNCGPSTRAA